MERAQFQPADHSPVRLSRIYRGTRFGAWSWGLEPERYGFPGQERPAYRTKALLANGNRIALERGPLEEWWVNDTRGLEHGFTLRERPVGSGGRLVFDLRTRGGLENCGVGRWEVG